MFFLHFIFRDFDSALHGISNLVKQGTGRQSKRGDVLKRSAEHASGLCRFSARPPARLVLLHGPTLRLPRSPLFNQISVFEFPPDRRFRSCLRSRDPSGMLAMRCSHSTVAGAGAWVVVRYFVVRLAEGATLLMGRN